MFSLIIDGHHLSTASSGKVDLMSEPVNAHVRDVANFGSMLKFEICRFSCSFHFSFVRKSLNLMRYFKSIIILDAHLLLAWSEDESWVLGVVHREPRDVNAGRRFGDDKHAAHVDVNVERLQVLDFWERLLKFVIESFSLCVENSFSIK